MEPGSTLKSLRAEELLPVGSLTDLRLPPPQPAWLMLAATLAEIVLPAVAAIVAVAVLGRPLTPAGNHAGVALAVSIALAAVAGLLTATLAQRGWRRSKLPGVSPTEFLPWRWLRHRRAYRRMAALVAQLQRTAVEQPENSLAVVIDLCGALARRDPYTRAHSGRVSRLAVGLGERVGLNQEECETARLAALMHDIGKLGIPASLINKPGPLDPYETSLVAQHTVIGAAMVAPFAGPEVARVIRHHHERVDGGGYPDGLSGETIPAIARLVAVADTYDALVSDRAYRPARSRAEAFGVLRSVAGQQLDATYVEVLIDMESGKLAVGVWGAVAPVLLPLAALLRRARHLVNVSPVPAAATATAVMLAATGVGLVPGVTLTRNAPARPAARVPVAVSPVVLPAPLPSPTATPTAAPAPPASPTASAAPAPTATHLAALAGRRAPVAVVALPVPAPVSTVTAPPPALPPAVLTPVLAAPPRNLNALLADLDGWAADNNLSVAVTSGGAGDLLVAFVAADGPAVGAQSVAAVTGGGVTWSLVARANATGGTAEVWTARAAGRLKGAKVAATLSAGNGTFGGAMSVLALAPPASLAAHATGGAAAGAPGVPLVTTAAGSALLAVGHDNSHTNPHVPLAGQTVAKEYLGPSTDTDWLQAAGPVPAANSLVTMGDSSPTTSPWDLATVEISP